MNQLRESLVITDARAVGLNRIPVKGNQSTYVLLIEGPLTPELADTLQCRNQAYTLNDSPAPSLKALSLGHQISSCELTALNSPPLQPSLVTGFTIKPAPGANAEGELEVHFRLKFSRYGKELNQLVSAARGEPFDLALNSLQGTLFDQKKPTEGDGEAGGTRVAMSDGGDDADEEEEEEEEESEDPRIAPPKRGRGRPRKE